MAEESEVGTFGVYFHTDEEVDEQEIMKDFSKYGNVVFVKQILTRVYVNFKSKVHAENCLQDTSNHKYGPIKRGRFGTSDKLNPNGYRNPHSLPQNKKTGSFDSGFAERSVKKTNTYTIEDDNFRDRNIKINNKFKSPPRNGRGKNDYQESQFNGSNKQSSDASQYNSDSPPPLLSVDNYVSSSLSDNDHPPPLLSVGDLPPPLLSLVDCPSPVPSIDVNMPPLLSARSCNSSSHKPGLLPTPPHSMRLDSNLLKDPSNVPPPLVSARSHPSSASFSRSPTSNMSYNDYKQKYGNYLVIANLPQDTNPDEVEKVLYPHIPISISEPEVTNVNMNVLYCLVTFNTQEAALKAAKQLDEVELRGYCLSMIRLDQLILFSNEPF